MSIKNVKMSVLLVTLLISSQTFAQGALFDFMKSSSPQAEQSTPYVVLDATNTKQKEKVTVQEFFSYGCPHCSDFVFQFDQWSKQQPKFVVVEKVPVTFDRPQWNVLGRLYYTLNELGQSNLDSSVYSAIHKDSKQLYTKEAIFDWAKSQKELDFNKFQQVFDSQSVTDKMAKANELSKKYKIDGVPTIVVDGNYKVSSKEGFKKLLSVTDELVVKVHKPAK